MTQPAKNLHAKRFQTCGRNAPFVVFLCFCSLRSQYHNLAMFEKVRNGVLILATFENVSHGDNYFSVSYRPEL